MVAGVVVGGDRKLTVFKSSVITERRWFKTLRERSILHLFRHTQYTILCESRGIFDIISLEK